MPLPISDTGYTFQLRRDTESNWYTNNPILHQGEIVFTINQGIITSFKVGDGERKWRNLPYYYVDNFNGTKLGDVYSKNQLYNKIKSTNVEEYALRVTDTGKKWKGKNIYSKVVTFGAGPNSTTVSVNASIQKVGNVITIKAVGENLSTGDCINNNNSDTIIYNKLDGFIYFTSTSDRSMYTYDVIIEYTIDGGGPGIILTVSGGKWGSLAIGTHLLFSTSYTKPINGSWERLRCSFTNGRINLSAFSTKISYMKTTTSGITTAYIRRLNNRIAFVSTLYNSSSYTTTSKSYQITNITDIQTSSISSNNRKIFNGSFKSYKVINLSGQEVILTISRSEDWKDFAMSEAIL